MGRAILIIGTAALAVGVIVYSLIECARTDSTEMRGLRKGGWIVVILLLPLIGALLWLFLGRPKGTPDGGRTARAKGPDDDPQFLRNLEERRRQQEQAEKLRRWEEQLEREGGPGAAGSTGSTGKQGKGTQGKQRVDRPGENPADGSSGHPDGLPGDAPGTERPPRD
ncbi:PLDc N-terminal domain-containing protein [Kocuria rosea]|uniref:PLDc N-terminal domain-containing protein n=1 Tax=Kocuria rosea TaxID=1275 RepID=UPI002041565F|nr:PLDc N-terminal domain-containing protein [Kocuria rosea]MCM3688756.1 PLDc N-terminal domain-containing protein [Kocuria rosea]